jgi:O-acetyl-ADP-ribose deacetylase (regulator of RNase III)
MVRYIFVDKNPKVVTTYRLLLETLPALLDRCDFEFHVGDVANFDSKRTAFVTSGNAFGHLDRGAGAVVARMFPGVQAKIIESIVGFNKLTLFRKPYIDIGSALLTPCGQYRHVITSPTMWSTQAVPETRNAMYAMQAVIAVVEKHNRMKTNVERIDKVVLTGLCTGVGNMPPVVSARQIAQAFSDHYLQHRAAHTAPQHLDNPYVIWRNVAGSEQPVSNVNREFRPPPRIIRSKPQGAR